MATILLNGQLQPSTSRGASARQGNVAARMARSQQPADISRATRRQAIRDAARTREIQRVYRRRRLGLMIAVATLVMVTGISVVSLFGTSASADGLNGQSTAPKFVVAQTGDTLWSIGERIAPNAAITEVVDELVRLNGSTIQTGQLVRIP